MPLRLLHRVPLALTLAFTLACTLAPRLHAQTGTLHLYQLNVGQGDGALLITPDHKAILIDAGPDRETVAARAAEILRREGVSSITLAIASHAHSDHIGGMLAVLQQIPVENYADNGVPYTSVTYTKTMQAVESKQIRYLKPTHRRITIGAVTLTFLPAVHALGASDQNDQSLGVLVEYGQFHALFTGDAERAERADWEHEGWLVPVQVLKVAHHGSVNGTDAPWLEHLSPALALISCGQGNTYGHPHARAISLLQAHGVQIARTDESGEILVTAAATGRWTVAATGTTADAHTAPAAHRRRTRAPSFFQHTRHGHTP